MSEQRLIAKIVPRHMDKKQSFQAVGVDSEKMLELNIAFHHPSVRKVLPFFQGCDGGWAMIEFWKDDDTEEVLEVAEYLSRCLGTELLHGDFTREELGLP